ncbi:MAG: uroporphyrinogen-III C-methyltransferase [Ruminococcus sp.]|nr:uroporphyrinogen-III C-methyltransferase [Ruminococcus sp.]
MKGRVYLIGAGCGDYDLITLRGLARLKECDTVVYDALIDRRLLDNADENAELISVGKRSGKHSAAQDEINDIIVGKALEGRTVARLKGGDPFVFGRGGEEAAALEGAGIPYEVIPGISSCIAVPELAGIPVTHRRVSRSFTVVTGHTADGNEDMGKYAKLGGTLVFLMGLNALPGIADSLIRGGMLPETPAAVISDGAGAAQKKVSGDLCRIADIAVREKCTAPAVIVVGETAGFDFSATVKRPLDGVSAAVTGTAGFVRKLSGMLEARGAQVSRMPYLKIEEYSEIPELSEAVENIGRYSWLVLTSRNGADIFIRQLRKMRTDIRRLSGLRIAVIGRGTAEALEKHGLYAELLPEKYTSSELGRALSAAADTDDRVLIVRAEKGSPDLTRVLSDSGIAYDDIKVYDTQSTSDKMCRTITEKYVIFASASGVDSFFEGGNTLSAETRVVCIGDITARAAAEHTGNRIITASPHTAEGIEAVIMEEEK